MVARQLLQCRILAHIQTAQPVAVALQKLQSCILAHIQFRQLVFVAIQVRQFFILAYIQTGQRIIGAVESLQRCILRHIQTGQFVFAARQHLQCRILAHIQTGQLVLVAIQLIQCCIVAHIQTGQLVFGAIQIRQCCVLVYIQTGQLVAGTIQILQVGKELNALQVTDAHIPNNDLLDSIPFRWCQLTIVVFVKHRFEIIPERIIREILFGQFDGAMSMRPPCRKGAEGQKGEYHSQRQKGTDKARSFCESLFHGVLLSFFVLLLLCGKGFQPVCAVEGRMVILPSTAASSISCSRKYSIRIS